LGGGEWDLALIDLNLPGTDGIELIQKGRERFPELSMMAVTGSTNNLMIDGAIRAGADYVLNKPVDRDELLRKIREFVKVEGTDADPAAASTSDVTPVEAAAAASIPTIVAVGVQPGDVEMGCGGLLFRHRAEGHQVIILNLAGGGDADSDLAAAAAQAAEVLGARMTNIGDGGTPDSEGASSLLQSVFSDSDLACSTSRARLLSHTAPWRAIDWRLLQLKRCPTFSRTRVPLQHSILFPISSWTWHHSWPARVGCSSTTMPSGSRT